MDWKEKQKNAGQRKKNNNPTPPAPGSRRARGRAGAHTRTRVGKPKRQNKHVKYDVAFRLEVVRMTEDEGYTAAQLHELLGVSESSVGLWLKRYREGGPDALKDQRPAKSGGAGKQKTPEPIREQIVELKQQFPNFGVKRISQLLRRLFFLPASPETVRKTLHEEELMPPKPRKKPKRNPEKPRFFERTTPNQLWQTDIFSFKLAGRQVYLLGFIDDYSRYIVGMELFTAQTAANVLEVYRRAVAEYGLPREMLTDNGRQYVNWRGVTRFQKELAKDKVKHIRSQPHHPMTLGKIERFWKTIWTEYLDRAQFGGFDEARSRIGLWLRYYNHKRPHQGIGGLCPADRYFEIQTELKTAIEQGIADNVLELALRGQVQAPFYMVGRMDKQSVVMQARKGKLTMSVGADGAPENTLTYDLKETDNEPETPQQLEIIHPGPAGGGIAPEHAGNAAHSPVDAGDGLDTGAAEEAPQTPVSGGQPQPAAEGGGDPLVVDGAAQASIDLQGAGHHLESAEYLAGPGAGGYAPGVAAPSGRGGGAVDPASGEAVRAQGLEAETTRGSETAAASPAGASQGGLSHGPESPRTTADRGEGPVAGGHHPAGAPSGADGGGGGESPRLLEEDLLQMGEPRVGGDGHGAGGPGDRPQASHPARPSGQGAGGGEQPPAGRDPDPEGPDEGAGHAG